MFKSIRWRIAVPYVLLILGALTILGVYLSRYVRQSYLDNLSEAQEAEARLIADNLGSDPTALQNPAGMDAQARHWAELLNARVTLIAADGLVLGESHEDRAQMDNHLDRVEVQQALARGLGSSIRFSRTIGYDMMYTAARIDSGGETTGVARVALPLDQVQADIAHLQRVVLGMSLAAALLGVVLALWIAERTTHPLRDLAEAASQGADGEPGASPSTDDEVGHLARVLNARAARLQTQLSELEAESRKLNSVLDQMTDGVLIADAQGRVQLINPAGRRIFGVKAENAIGHSLAEVLHYYQLVELWRNCLKTGETQTFSLELGPRLISLHGIAAPLDSSLPGSTLLVFQDLTRIRQLETIRRDFVSNVSHELRTPLASIKALNETIQESMAEDPEATQRFLQRMNTEIDAITQLISELLELSRIESGRALLHFESVHPRTFIMPAVERLSLQAERAGLRLEVSLPDGLPAVLADAPRMEQTLVNIVHNAIKFTPEGGSIRVSAHEDSGEMLISVADTGVGIAREDLSRIFERFYKADRARSGGGTGLGLAIARHLVEAHGGRIWAESVEGKGSTFVIALPIFGRS